MALLYTKNYDVIALRNAYHGMWFYELRARSSAKLHNTGGTPSAMGVTAHSTWKYTVPQGSGVHHALNPNMYRGPYGYDDPDAASKYAADVKDLIQHATPGKVAAFIAESIQVRFNYCGLKFDKL